MGAKIVAADESRIDKALYGKDCAGIQQIDVGHPYVIVGAAHTPEMAKAALYDEEQVGFQKPEFESCLGLAPHRS